MNEETFSRERGKKIREQKLEVKDDEYQAVVDRCWWTDLNNNQMTSWMHIDNIKVQTKNNCKLNWKKLTINIETVDVTKTIKWTNENI